MTILFTMDALGRGQGAGRGSDILSRSTHGEADPAPRVAYTAHAARGGGGEGATPHRPTRGQSRLVGFVVLFPPGSARTTAAYVAPSSGQALAARL